MVNAVISARARLGEDSFDRAQRDLIAGDKKKSGDSEGGERLEFGVAVRVTFVRLRGRRISSPPGRQCC